MPSQLIPRERSLVTGKPHRWGRSFVTMKSPAGSAASRFVGIMDQRDLHNPGANPKAVCGFFAHSSPLFTFLCLETHPGSRAVENEQEEGKPSVLSRISDSVGVSVGG